MFDIRTELDLQNMTKLGNGEGKNSDVYLANDIQLGNQFIVKKIDKNLIFKDYGDTSESNLFNESKILYKVSHPNITSIQYASYDDNNIYVVMPFYRNGSIQTLLEHRYLTAREVIKYSLDFLSGLMHVHANNLIHFDIKPTNILINNNGKAALTDFGIAKYINETTEVAEPIKLYNSHKPPEYFISHSLSRQSDIYQAGVTMYRMANGNCIWTNQFNTATFSDIINGKFPDRKYYMPHIPKKLYTIINKCMNIDLDKRYSTVLDVINALSTIDGNLDWVYRIESSTTQIWENTENNMHTQISLVFNDNNYEIKTNKTNIDTSRTAKVTKMTKSNISQNDAYKMIATFIG